MTPLRIALAMTAVIFTIAVVALFIGGIKSAVIAFAVAYAYALAIAIATDLAVRFLQSPISRRLS